jgi:glycosyltransferase involved in cell wall biosynthesis
MKSEATEKNKSETIKSNGISLCMIVKNEGETLAKSLESLEGLVDEIVIGIDDSSTDESEEIARRYTDKVSLFRWENDFSKARNQMIARCSCGWILQVDGHEILRENCRDRFSRIVELLPPDVEAVGFKLKMQEEDHNSSGLQLRMFKNNGNIRYKHKAHNIIDCDSSRTVAFTDIVFDHVRTLDNRQSRSKQRSKMVPQRMREALTKNPADTKALYYLGIHAHDEKEYEKAISYYERYLKHSDSSEESYKVLWHLGRCYYNLCDEQKARETFIKGTNIRWDLAECYVSLGEIALERCDWDEAEHFFKLGCDRRQPLSGVFFSEDYYTWLPYYKLCEVYDRAGSDYQAIIIAEKLLGMGELPDKYRKELEKQVLVWNGRFLESKKISYGDETKKNFLIVDKTGSFTSELEAHLKKSFNVKKMGRFLPQYMRWADYAWFDWCDEQLVLASQIRWQAKVMVQFRSYELFTDMPANVNWSNVDRVMFVGDHVRQRAIAKFPSMKNSTILMNTDGIDLGKFTFRERTAGLDVAWVGFLNLKKNFPLLLQIAQEYPNYTFHVAGRYQDERLQTYVEHFIQTRSLSNVKFYGWIDDIDKFLDDKQYIISTSLWEGTHLSVLEGMAKGLKPLIYNWPGSENIYSREWLFNSPGGLQWKFRGEKYDSNEYRRWVEERYSLSARQKRTDDLIDELERENNSMAQTDEAARRAASPSLTETGVGATGSKQAI